MAFFILSDWLHGHGKAALCEAKFYGLHDRKNPANAALNVYRASEYLYGSSATGYTDYPTLSQSDRTQETSNVQ
jgi:hypothetical protein